MNILYYIHSLEIGGAEKVVVDNVKALAKAGNRLTLVVNRHTESFFEKDLKTAGIEIVSLFNKKAKTKFGKAAFLFYRSLFGARKSWKRILTKVKPDIIHVNTYMDRFYSHKIPADRIVYTFHSEVERSLNIGTKKNLKKLHEFSKNGGYFFALTSRIADSIKQIFNTDKVSIIPNSVCISDIKQKTLDRNEFLSELGIPDDAFVVGHVGRFHPVKNHPKLISVFSEIEKRHPNSFLLLIGDGTENEKRIINAQIEAFNLKEKVKFLGIRKDATAIMSALDVLVLPSLSESFSLVLLEAQIHGTRCVASTGVPEDVICNANCFRLELNEDSSAWAEKALSSDQRNQYTDIGKFDIHNVTEQMISVYKQITGGGNYEKNSHPDVS